MKKAEMIRELEELLEILKTPSNEYAEKINGENDGCKLDDSGTYPYRVGVAIATIEFMVNGKF